MIKVMFLIKNNNSPKTENFGFVPQSRWFHKSKLIGWKEQKKNSENLNI